MDTFTQSILERARERQRLLEGYTPVENVSNRNSEESEVNKSETILTTNCCSLRENDTDSLLPKMARQNSKTRVSSNMPGSPKSKTKTLNIQQENFNMEITLSSTENVRVEVEIEGSTDQGDSESGSGLRDESKRRFKQLGRLYAGGDEADISSPIHKTEGRFYEKENVHVSDKSGPENVHKSSKGGLSKLAQLAETINQWEDDIHPTSCSQRKLEPKQSSKPPAPQPPVASPSKTSLVKAPIKPRAPEIPNAEEGAEIERLIEQSTSPKKKLISTQVDNAVSGQLNWDQNVLNKLESQGFTRTDSNSKLVYSYNLKNINPEAESAQQSMFDKIQNNLNVNEIEKGGKTCGLKSGNVINRINIISLKPTDGILKEKRNDIPSSPTRILAKSANTSSKTAISEHRPNKVAKDPALLSVSERKALFEKNRGEALIPKPPFAMVPPPMKVGTTLKTSTTQIVTENSVTTTKIHTSTQINAKPQDSKTLSIKPIVQTASMVMPQADGIASKMALLLGNKTTISQTQIENSIRSERQKEMDMLLNRFNKDKETRPRTNEVIIEESESDGEEATEESAMLKEKTPEIVNVAKARRQSAEKRKSGIKARTKEDSPIVAAILDEVKRIKVSPPKTGRLYPNLSDIEATTETETDNMTRTPTPEGYSSYDEDNCESDDPNTSFGQEILRAVCKNHPLQAPQKRSILDYSTASDISNILDDDSYIDEMSNEDKASVGPTPPKQVCQIPKAESDMQPSNSFNYKSFSNSNTPMSQFASPTKTLKSLKTGTELPEYVVEGNDILPLTHTVSFYRKQQNQVQTPVKQITRLPLMSKSSEEHLEEHEAVEHKIKELQGEVHKQQNIISQTSQALNLCSCTPEFSGSTEQVEAERVLLVASHRRQAALHELQRLRVEKTIRPLSRISKNLPLEKGQLTISDIVLPLKHKYVKALAAAGGKGHHVVCLVKYGEQILPTKLVSTVVSNKTNPDTELTIPGSITLSNIYSDFTIILEVYCLQAQEEFLPHEVKYHINNKKASGKLTPKKSKQDSRMIMPMTESPGGPQAVRTSSFALMGYVVFSVQALNRKIWTLNNTPPMSPLEGTVEMNISCELAVSVEHRGFLTMFNDISGFGAWHRRWCLLKGNTLSYWKYPDDEKKMAPIDTIDLKNCITKQVGSVNREICARLHTFLLEREREAHSQDKNSLVTLCKGDKTIIRHLFSADTKEERIEWCTKFNAALTALRMWGNS